jgi:hypothetical protein
LGHSYPSAKPSSKLSNYPRRGKLPTVTASASVQYPLSCTFWTVQAGRINGSFLSRDIGLAHVRRYSPHCAQRQSQWLYAYLTRCQTCFSSSSAYHPNFVYMYVMPSCGVTHAAGVCSYTVPFSRKSFLILGQYQELNPEPHTLSFTIDTTTTLTPGAAACTPIKRCGYSDTPPSLASYLTLLPRCCRWIAWPLS